jgi:hypothetical protein
MVFVFPRRGSTNSCERNRSRRRKGRSGDKGRGCGDPGEARTRGRLQGAPEDCGGIKVERQHQNVGNRKQELCVDGHSAQRTRTPSGVGIIAHL